MTKKIVLAISCLVLLWGCAKKTAIKSKPLSSVTQDSNVQDKNVQRNIEDESEPSIRSTEWQSIPELKTITFNYDETMLQKEARDRLSENAGYLNSHPGPNVIVEGHCCECGTNEYNMSLGQKRAKVVRDYYIKLGVAANRIATISYGEEKLVSPHAGPPDSPLCKKNRRAETKVRNK